MNLISIDLELNQPSKKIIQLGYVISNVKTQTIKCSKRLYVNPCEVLSNDIINLTGITQKQVDCGSALFTAYHIMCQDIQKYQVTKHPIQWGLDHFELRNQLRLEWDEYVFRRRAHDIKSFYQLYQMTTPNGKTVAGLNNALKQCDLSWDVKHGHQHDALADAYNTLLIYFHLSDKMKKYDQIEKVAGKK
jgi:inhibitor of KinA sporulation pathway (predicted exonuclease)